MALTLTNDILKFRESTSDPWEKLLIQANMNFNLIYPVGSIYMSTVNVDPGTIFGGTWERLKDRFLLGAGDTYTAGDTGGESEHTLTVDEMPSHTHDQGKKYNTSLGNYSPDAPWTANSGTVYSWPTGSAGGDAAHNNMPPYLVVYMWRRLTLSPTIYTPPASVLIGDVASEDIVPIAKGGTGADNAADALSNLGVTTTTELCTFTGTTATSKSLSESAGNYVFLLLAVYSSYGNIIGAVVTTASIASGLNVQVFGESSSQWGSMVLDSGFTSATFNRTSANTSKVCLFGMIKWK